jgi:hypothetical protein
MWRITRIVRGTWAWVEHAHTLWWIIYSVGGGGVMAALIWLIGWFRTHVDIVAILSTFVGSSVLIALGIWLWSTNESTRLAKTKQASTLGPLLPVPDVPRMDKITVEILEGFVAERMMNAFSFPEPWILLRVRLVNRNDPSVTIKNWELDLKDHSGITKWSAHKNDIPDNSTYTSLMSWPESSRKEEAIGTRVDKRLSTTPLSLGCGEEGWLLFRTFQCSMCYVFGKTFQLTVTDALDNRSQGVVYPGEWLKPARFSF